MNYRKIMLSKTVGFRGRNGYFKCIGFEITKYVGDSIIYLNPITSKNTIGNCQIEIPLDDINLFIKNLKDLKNE